jgi:hypothetical protein
MVAQTKNDRFLATNPAHGASSVMHENARNIDALDPEGMEQSLADVVEPRELTVLRGAEQDALLGSLKKNHSEVGA